MLRLVSARSECGPDTDADTCPDRRAGRGVEQTRDNVAARPVPAHPAGWMALT